MMSAESSARGGVKVRSLFHDETRWDGAAIFWSKLKLMFHTLTEHSLTAFPVIQIQQDNNLPSCVQINKVKVKLII